MIRILYSIGLFLIAVLALPKLLYMFIFHRKYRKSLLKRFGKDFPIIKKENRPLFWIHAVSVGETKAIAPLCRLLKNSTKNPLLLISSTTETGQEEALRSIPFADYHVYLPFDFNCVVRPLLQKAKPDWVILCESDFWFNFLTNAKDNGAMVALVNGKISENSSNRFKKIPFLTNKLFSLFDLFCIQNEYYKKRFEELGIPSEKLHVTGNIKFDDPHPKLPLDQLNELKSKLGIAEGDLVLVVGSSHDPEEKMIIELLPKLWEEFPNLKLILVPRHPERFNEVGALLKKSNIEANYFTKLDEAKWQTKVVLIDRMGLLRQCYQMADLAVVGGSFINRVGGHNILEPGWYGVPVVFGPYMHSQPELLELCRQYQSGIQTDKENLEQTLFQLLRDPIKREQLGKAGKRLVDEAQGATEKTFEYLNKKNAI